MKIDLNAQATVAIKDLMTRFKSHNEFITKRFSILVSELVLFTANSITQENIELITRRLIPDKKKGRVLLKQIEKMYANADLEQLSQLEKSIEKIKPKKIKNIENSAQKG